MWQYWALLNRSGRELGVCRTWTLIPFSLTIDAAFYVLYSLPHVKFPKFKLFPSLSPATAAEISRGLVSSNLAPHRRLLSCTSTTTIHCAIFPRVFEESLCECHMQSDMVSLIHDRLKPVYLNKGVSFCAKSLFRPSSRCGCALRRKTKTVCVIWLSSCAS